MHDEVDWSEVERGAREAVARLSFLVGRWEGEGSDHGQPVRARLEVTPTLDGTFLEAREQWLAGDGSVEHEDRALYRWSHEESAVRVLHLMAPALVADRVVRFDGDGQIHWDGGPVAPVVRWSQTEAGRLRCTVQLPFTAAPATVVEYQRAD